MCKNANESADLIIERIANADENHGWDFKNNCLVNMYESGIIDPAKVTRVALQNATSVSSILVTTSNAIVEVKK